MFSPSVPGFCPNRRSDAIAKWKQTFQIEVYPLVKSLSLPRLLTAMGIQNSILYCAAQKYQAVTTVEKAVNPELEQAESVERSKIRSIVPEQVKRLAKLSESGGMSVEIPISHWADYLKKFWEGACNSCPTLRKMREWLSELGLFEFVERAKTEKGGDRNPPVLKRLNIWKLLAFYELCEAELFERASLKNLPGWALLPEHKANFVRILFDALFAGVNEFRRVEPCRGTKSVEIRSFEPVEPADLEGWEPPMVDWEEAIRNSEWLEKLALI